MTESPDPLDPETRRRLETLAAQAHARSAEHAAGLERRKGLPAAPGDLFVLRATADLPVEWAILDRGNGGKLLAMPADSGAPAGTADVEVPADAPGGPLNLRCRYGTWLDGALFEPDLRSGTLAPETITEALHRLRQIEAGALEGSPLAEEVDADPEYADWIRDVPERARELASAARASNPRPSSASSWGMAHRLAAVLAVVSIGLALWVGFLLRQVEQLSEPIFDAPSEEVVLGDEVRGGTVFQVPREEKSVTLVLVVDSAIEPQDGYLEIADRTGQPVWRSRRVRLIPDKGFPLTLARRLLPDGDYRVRVFPEAGFGAPPLAEETLRVESTE
ncbi:MAG TPA: hypothetical protein VJ725_04480 [Thermoanaerobaculia bacterium]|nr:hypothetical protein [Thermoanaerobaculia bacterium]